MKSIIPIPILLVTVFLLNAVIYGQQTPPDDEVVKVSTNLVQVDTVVTDRYGNSVTNLTANDFEILQDGKPQVITNVSFINRIVTAEVSDQSQTVTAGKSDKNILLPPPAASRSKEFGRVLTFVVDDGNCDATQTGMLAIRTGLEKFVNEQMLPNDSVAIYQTRAGSALLQQYTSDKALLQRIIRKIRWYPPNGICADISGNDYLVLEDKSTTKEGGTFESDKDRERREAGTDSVKDRQVTGVIGVATYAIKGLQRIGGRKILFLMSDSFAITNGRKNLPNAFSAARDLATLANRASVVINTIDDRGLINAMIEARDDVGGLGKTDGILATGPVIADRIAFDDSRQSGLSYVANETGGKFYRNMNNLDVPVGNALKSENGYYLISYDPEEETFKGKNFHKIEIKLKRPELISSSRSGFYGITDAELRPKPRTGDSGLYDVLSSPLPNADMNIKLSAHFANTAGKGNFIHALLFIDGQDITFVNEADGAKKAVFDIVAVTLDEKNKVVDDSNHTNTIHIPADKVEEIKRNGLIYSVDVPVKKEGVYTFRTALREASAKRLGSASQIIEVPALKKDRIFVSGLILSSVDANGKIHVSEEAAAENPFSTAVSKAIPAIRQFRRNTVMAYAYKIYNAKIDPATNQPKLSIQTNLYRDGKIFSKGAAQNAQLEPQTDITRISDYGYLRLNAQVPVGDYALQIIIKDLQTNQITSQWIDFEVVE